MKETIGDIIKRLRKERDLTQEELAEQLNISSAAVSKWENNIGMPDISNIVPLANLFGVSTDILFGVHGVDRENEIDKLLDEIFKMQENVPQKDQARVGLSVLDKYRDALRKYPCNSKILCNAVCFAGMLLECNGEELKTIIGANAVNELIKERIQRAKLVIKYSDDQNDVLCAKRNLMEIYAEQRNWEAAFDIAKSFPADIYNIRDIRLAELKWQAGESEEQQILHCRNIEHLLASLGHQVFMLGNLYREKSLYEDALYCYSFIGDVISSLYRNNEYVPPFHDKGYPLFLFPAYCLVKLERYDEAIDLLEKCFDYYTAQAKHFNVTEKLNTPLLRDCRFSYGYEGTAKYKDPIKAARDIICNSVFKPLWDDPRYVSLTEKIV